jgi:hypothetical protein
MNIINIFVELIDELVLLELVDVLEVGLLLFDAFEELLLLVLQIFLLALVVLLLSAQFIIYSLGL